tara:strand:+ start:317 stop:580 length:264 start_codon:yes stop_codon:yes gene_type:complete
VLDKIKLDFIGCGVIFTNEPRRKMLSLPLIRTDDESQLTPFDRTAFGLDSVITALMMHATMLDPNVTKQEIETYTTLSVATILPAEA